MHWQFSSGLFLQWENITSIHLSLLPCNDLENLQTSSGNDLGEKNTAEYNMGAIPVAQVGRAWWVAGGAGGAGGMAGMAGASGGSTVGGGAWRDTFLDGIAEGGLNEQRWKKHEM